MYYDNDGDGHSNEDGIDAIDGDDDDGDDDDTFALAN